MTSVLGVDCSTFVRGQAGLDPMFTLIEGERAVIEACARRLMTQRGTIPGLPDCGYDMTEKVGSRVTPVVAARLRADIRDELLKDERVLEVSTLELVQTAPMQWRLDMRITIATGPFDLVLGVSQVTVEILRASRG